MTYYLVKIMTYNDGTADKKALYEYETETLAMAAYHKEIGSTMETETVETTVYIVCNSVGGILAVDYFNRDSEEETEE